MASGPGPIRERTDLDEFAALLAQPDDDGTDDGGHRSRHGRERRRRPRIWPWLLAILLILLLAVGAAGWWAYRTYPEQVKTLFGWSNDYKGAGTGEVHVVVHPDDTGGDVADTLLADHVTKTRSAFYDLLVRTTPQPSLEPGTYRLRKHMSAASALGALEDPKSRLQFTVAIPEGSSEAGILKTAASSTGLPLADLQAAAKDREALGIPSSAPNTEGWLFPATYTFQPGVTAQQVVQQMVARTRTALQQAGVAREDDERVLTLAGLVQKEGNGQDDAKVARVFLNRIKKGMPLQSDASVSYGAGGTTVVPTKQQYADRNGYNTYLRKGLPIGPISSPGDQAIAAAVHPAKGKWLFFVTVNLQTGETVFSDTLAEHDRAADQFQRWLKAHPSYAK